MVLPLSLLLLVALVVQLTADDVLSQSRPLSCWAERSASDGHDDALPCFEFECRLAEFGAASVTSPLRLPIGIFDGADHDDGDNALHRHGCAPPADRSAWPPRGAALLVWRGGGCAFTDKAITAASTGARAVLVANTDDEVFPMAGPPPESTAAATLPAALRHS